MQVVVAVEFIRAELPDLAAAAAVATAARVQPMAPMG